MKASRSTVNWYQTMYRGAVFSFSENQIGRTIMKKIRALLLVLLAAMLCALDRALPDGLDAALSAYYARYAFGRATREDFEALLRSVTGEDLSSLIRDYLDTSILN